MKNRATTLYSVGHGRHSWQDFLALLQKHEIEFLCDVRSFARSRWVQFNGVVLAENLRVEGIGYEWLPETGGKFKPIPEDLNRGVERILELAAEVRTVMMCSESQPLTKHKIPRANCHRVGMLAPMLKAKGAKIIHILPDGSASEFDEAGFFSIW
ncbi:MAG TPA: DUF488 domain-containing protein [Pyrinomonadaceae bacterium]|nr:DUF488 domain-containing protein [Pyrinomonadaceae bacterium]